MVAVAVTVAVLAMVGMVRGSDADMRFVLRWVMSQERCASCLMILV